MQNSPTLSLPNSNLTDGTHGAVPHRPRRLTTVHAELGPDAAQSAWPTKATFVRRRKPVSGASPLAADRLAAVSAQPRAVWTRPPGPQAGRLTTGCAAMVPGRERPAASRLPPRVGRPRAGAAVVTQPQHACSRSRPATAASERTGAAAGHAGSAGAAVCHVGAKDMRRPVVRAPPPPVEQAQVCSIEHTMPHFCEV